MNYLTACLDEQHSYTRTNSSWVQRRVKLVLLGELWDAAVLIWHYIKMKSYRWLNDISLQTWEKQVTWQRDLWSCFLPRSFSTNTHTRQYFPI